MDEIDALFSIEYLGQAASIFDDVSFNEAIALFVILASTNRPHVAMKGAAVLAPHSVGILEQVGRMYDLEWTPHMRRGHKTLSSAKLGHETVHGSHDEKLKRWGEQCTGYDKALIESHGQKTLAKILAADRCGCSVKTIERSLARRRDGEI